MTRTTFESVTAKSARVARDWVRKVRTTRTPEDRLRVRLRRLRELRRVFGYAPRTAWLRVGIKAPPLLLHPAKRIQLISGQVRRVSSCIAKAERAKAIQSVFDRLSRHEGRGLRAAPAPPPSEILSQYRLVYNVAPEFVKADDELAAQAMEELLHHTARDDGGDFPPLPDFRFTKENIREALRILGGRKCAGGVSGATYTGLREVIRREPHLVEALVGELESLRGRLLLKTDFIKCVLPVVSCNQWPNVARKVKLTLIPKTSPPDPVNVRKWRPVSNAETALKVPMESMRRGVLSSYVMPLPPSSLTARGKRWFSRFCSEGVVVEGLSPGGGPDYLTRYLQMRVDSARRRNRGLTVIFLDLQNGFGSVPHSRILPGLLAMGLDRSAAVFLSFVFVNGIAVLGGDVFDVVVGIFQGLASSPFVFSLILTLALIATAPEDEGGIAISLIDDTAIYFDGVDSRTSRRAAQVWTWKAQRMFKAFGLTLNVQKSAVLSVEGRLGRTHFPSEKDWASLRVGPEGSPFPCITVGNAPWAVKSFRYLGRTVRAGSSDLLKRSGIFDPEARQGQGSFVEALSSLVRDVAKETRAVPFLAKLERLNEVLPQILYGRLDSPATTRCVIDEMGAILRRKVRELGRFPGYLGNSVSTRALHRPRRHWGFGLMNLEQSALLTGIRNLGKALHMPATYGAPFNPARLLLLEPLLDYLKAYEVATGFDPWESWLTGLEKYAGPYPAVNVKGWPEVVPVELIDGAAITRKRLSANSALSQFPSLLSALMAADGRVLYPDGTSAVPAGKLEFKTGKTITCVTVSEAVATAREILRGKFEKHHPAAPAVVKNAEKGWSCAGAKCLGNARGLRLQQMALLGPVCEAKWKLRRGPYRHVGDGSRGRRISANSPGCNACGKVGPMNFVGHVMGGAPGSKFACPSTRRLVLIRHAELARKVALAVAEGRTEKGGTPRFQLEVPMDTDLRRSVQGKEKARADAVTMFPLEAVVSEVSVSLNPVIATGKGRQLQKYVEALSTAAGIPKTGWPVPVLWRRVGLGALIARLERYGKDFVLAYAIGEDRRYCQRASVGRRGSLHSWLQKAVGELVDAAIQTRADRIVVIAKRAEERVFRREWERRSPPLNLAVVPPRQGRPRLSETSTSVTGYSANKVAGEAAGLAWPRFCAVRPPKPGPLRVVGCLGIFDPLGTAYPNTGRSYLGLGGRGKVQKVGAGVLSCMPAFVREWKGATARKRASKQLLRVSKAR